MSNLYETVDKYFTQLLDSGEFMKIVADVFKWNDVYDEDDVLEELRGRLDPGDMCGEHEVREYVSENATVDEVFGDGYVYHETITEEQPNTWYDDEYLYEWCADFYDEQFHERYSEIMYESFMEDLTGGCFDDRLGDMGWVKSDADNEEKVK